jgi:molybdopterin molybdotransferase
MSKLSTLLNDCFLHDKDRLRHDEVLTLLDERLHSIVEPQSIKLEDCMGAILAQSIIAPRAVPLFDNAAVDGYAFNSTSIADKHIFEVTSRVPAGELNPSPLGEGEAARIFTGALMPPNADTVAMQEDCTVLENGKVQIPSQLKAGANCRLKGEDLKEGEALFEIGHSIRAQDMASIASVGLDKITCYRPLKIALLSTGDEIIRPGTKMKTGQVYDANHFLLRGLLDGMNVELTDNGIIKDDPKTLRMVIENLRQSHDVILTTGGASKGEEDHIITIMDELGHRHLWQLAIKPGRPMSLANISTVENNCLHFGLPGNPVAAMVCFLHYVKPALSKLGGSQMKLPARYPLPADFEITKKKRDRREFLRGILKRADNGTLQVAKFKSDGSGIISSLREADGLIEIPEEVERVNHGDLVSFIPFSQF